MAHRSDFLEVRGVRTHLLKGGRGRPLLVLHPEFGANMWAPYHDVLAAHFTVLAPDHLGFGQSDRPDWLETIDDLVFHYLDLLDTLELERLSIVGTSLGGWIAAAFAVAHPERVERLVLAAPAGVKVDGVERYDFFANSFEELLAMLPNWRSTFIFREVVPKLLEGGLSQADVDTILVENPRRLFAAGLAKSS